MSDQQEPAEHTSPSSSIHWVAAAVLAVLALVAGVWLGRVAFVSSTETAPIVVDIEVLDDDLEVGGTVEYLEEHEIYILLIHTMPPPDDGRVFQVWVQVDDLVVNAGVLNPDSREFAFAAYSGRYDTLFITDEPGPLGSQQPTSEELITADLTELEPETD